MTPVTKEDNTVKLYILQEFCDGRAPGWIDVPGSVRDTYDEAAALLAEFEAGKGYSFAIIPTGRYRIDSFEARASDTTSAALRSQRSTTMNVEKKATARGPSSGLEGAADG